MTYAVRKSDGTVLVNIQPNTIDTTTTSLGLFGQGFLDYGQDMADNLVWLLENFASGLPPVNPLKGQLWYDTSQSTAVLRIFNGSAWEYLNSGLGEGGLPQGGSTVAGNSGGSIRVSGAAPIALQYGPSTTSAVALIAEGKIISIVSPEAIPNSKLAPLIEIFGLIFTLKSRFPNGLVAGQTMATDPSTPYFTNTVVISRDPIAAQEGATKHYVDTQISLNIGNLSGSLSVVAFSGNYNDLLNKPIISVVGHTGQYADILNLPVISAVGHTGQYADLLNAPVLSPVALSGNYNDLTYRASDFGSNSVSTSAVTVNLLSMHLGCCVFLTASLGITQNVILPPETGLTVGSRIKICRPITGGFATIATVDNSTTIVSESGATNSITINGGHEVDFVWTGAVWGVFGTFVSKGSLDYALSQTIAGNPFYTTGVGAALLCNGGPCDDNACDILPALIGPSPGTCTSGSPMIGGAQYNINSIHFTAANGATTSNWGDSRWPTTPPPGTWIASSVAKTMNNWFDTILVRIA